MLSAYGTTHTSIAFDDTAMEKFRQDFDEGNCFTTLAGITGYRSFEYDPETFPLRGGIERLVVSKGLIESAEALAQAGGLEGLHHLLPKELMDLDKDEVNQVTRQFYDTDAGFQAAYLGFLKDFCERHVGEECLFQRTPTIRFHFPHQRGFNWAPRFHTDVMLGHPPQEGNIWLPVTRCYGTNSMLLAPLAESLGILRDYQLDFTRYGQDVQTNPDLQARLNTSSYPVDLSNGQFVIFDSRCLHGTQHNKSMTTRISLDFRVLPLSGYRAMRVDYRGTGRLKMPFRRGDYYDERTTAEI